jgi:hypothetical protein
MTIYDLIVITVTDACYPYHRTITALAWKHFRLRLAIVSRDKSAGDGDDLLRLGSAKELTTLRHAITGKYPIGRFEDLAISQS